MTALEEVRSLNPLFIRMGTSIPRCFTHLSRGNGESVEVNLEQNPHKETVACSDEGSGRVENPCESWKVSRFACRLLVSEELALWLVGAKREQEGRRRRGSKS